MQNEKQGTILYTCDEYWENVALVWVNLQKAVQTGGLHNVWYILHKSTQQEFSLFLLFLKIPSQERKV